jgi:hypothetical protein
MTCFRTWYFNDGIGGIWGIGLDDDGLVTLTQNQNADNPMDFALLNDFDTNQVWKLSVLPSGQLNDGFDERSRARFTLDPSTRFPDRNFQWHAGRCRYFGTAT